MLTLYPKQDECLCTEKRNCHRTKRVAMRLRHYVYYPETSAPSQTRYALAFVPLCDCRSDILRPATQFANKNVCFLSELMFDMTFSAISHTLTIILGNRSQCSFGL
jgi:hypothetical protein